MNSRLVFIIVAVMAFAAYVSAMYADADPTTVAFLEQDSESSLLAELEAEADAEADAELEADAEEEGEADADEEGEAEEEADVDADAEEASFVEMSSEKSNSRTASYKPSGKARYTGGAIKPALIHDNHILSGKARKQAKRQIGTFKVEPPSAVLPPILGDVDEKILNMAYDLSFEKRPTQVTALRRKLNRGAKLLNAYTKMKKTLEWAMETPKDKKGPKQADAAKKDGAKKADAKKAPEPKA